MAVDPDALKKRPRGSDAAMPPLTPSEMAEIARRSLELRSMGEDERDDVDPSDDRPGWYDQVLTEVADQIQEAVAYVSELATDGGHAAISEQNDGWPAHVLSVEEWIEQATGGKSISEARRNEYVREHRLAVQAALEDGSVVVAPEALNSHPGLSRAMQEQAAIDAQKQANYEYFRDSMLTDYLPVQNLDQEDRANDPSHLAKFLAGHNAASESSSESAVVVPQPVQPAAPAVPPVPAPIVVPPVQPQTPAPVPGLGSAATNQSPSAPQSSEPRVVPQVDWSRSDIRDIVSHYGGKFGTQQAKSFVMHVLHDDPTAYGNDLRAKVGATSSSAGKLPPIEEAGIDFTMGADAAMPQGEWQSELTPEQVEGVAERRQKQFTKSATNTTPQQSEPSNDPHAWWSPKKGMWSKRSPDTASDTPISHPDNWEHSAETGWRRKRAGRPATEPEATPASEAAVDRDDKPVASQPDQPRTEFAEQEREDTPSPSQAASSDDDVDPAIQAARDEFAQTRERLDALRDRSQQNGARSVAQNIWQAITGGSGGSGGGWIGRILGGAAGGGPGNGPGGGGGNNGGGGSGGAGSPPDDDGNGGGGGGGNDDWLSRLLNQFGGGEGDEAPWWAPAVRPVARAMQRGGAGFAIGAAQGGPVQGALSGMASMALGAPVGVPVGGLAAKTGGFISDMPQWLENADQAQVARTGVAGAGAVGGAGLATGVGLALGGPVGAAAGAAVGAGFEKLVDWTVKLVEGLHAFSDRINDSNKELAKYNGTIAAGQMRLELGNIKRQFELGDATSGSAAALSDAVNARNDATTQFNEDVGNVSNKTAELAANGVEVLGKMYVELRRLADDAPVLGRLVQSFFDWCKGEVRKPKQDTPTKMIFKDIMSERPARKQQQDQRDPINPMWEK